MNLKTWNLSKNWKSFLKTFEDLQKKYGIRLEINAQVDCSKHSKLYSPNAIYTPITVV